MVRISRYLQKLKLTSVTSVGRFFKNHNVMERFWAQNRIQQSKYRVYHHLLNDTLLFLRLSHNLYAKQVRNLKKSIRKIVYWYKVFITILASVRHELQFHSKKEVNWSAFGYIIFLPLLSLLIPISDGNPIPIFFHMPVRMAAPIHFPTPTHPYTCLYFHLYNRLYSHPYDCCPSTNSFKQENTRTAHNLYER